MKTCGIDGCTYRTGGSLTSHRAAKHNVSVVWHQCDQLDCAYRAKTAGNLKQHRSDVHDIGVK